MKSGRILIGLLTFTLIEFLFVSPVWADISISVNGNGANSVNEAEVEREKKVEVTQENEAEVDNQVKNEANTGGNQATSNGGAIDIKTGDVETKVEIDNEINQSQIDLRACPNCEEIVRTTIENNGSETQNEVNLVVQSTLGINVTNRASISNEVIGNANTGDNLANNNQGDVRIRTGNINVFEEVKNTKVNLYDISAGTTNFDLFLAINGNGSGSINELKAHLDDVSLVKIAQLAELRNRSDWDLNTGGNEAQGNLGKVTIETGNIFVDTRITNDGINAGGVVLDPCCSPDEPDQEGDDNNGDVIPPVTPPNVPGVNDNHKDHDDEDDDEDDDGEVLGAKIGNVLPATGGYWMFLATLGNVLMLIMGVYLRLRSGRSPASCYEPAYL